MECNAIHSCNVFSRVLNAFRVRESEVFGYCLGGCASYNVIIEYCFFLFLLFFRVYSDHNMRILRKSQHIWCSIIVVSILLQKPLLLVNTKDI